MFERIVPHAEDKIIALMQAYAADPRPDKIDLGVGVYRDAAGHTPIMRAVKTAERQLIAAEATKGYVALAGDPGFHRAMTELILGAAAPLDRISAAATPGGTGAVRHALELIKMTAPGATVWLPDPTWPNHPSIIDYLGIQRATYRYFDTETRGVDVAGILADLDGVAAGDVVLVHGCCHNPTGANLTAADWAEVAEVLRTRRAVALVDLAYQGFGDGLDADAAPTRALVAALPEVLIAASCSKNFGVYRERVGILIAASEAGRARDLTGEALTHLNRQNYSFPPDHGARLVTMILDDAALRADWAAELEAMRTEMLGLRVALADALRDQTGSDRFDHLAEHRGMFSLLKATPDQVTALQRDHGVYVVGDGRMNVAGLRAETVPALAAAIGAVGI